MEGKTEREKEEFSTLTCYIPGQQTWRGKQKERKKNKVH